MKTPFVSKTWATISRVIHTKDTGKCMAILRYENDGIYLWTNEGKLKFENLEEFHTFLLSIFFEYTAMDTLLANKKEDKDSNTRKEIIAGESLADFFVW